MNMSYNVLFFLIAHNMKLSLFNFFQFKWLNSQNFDELYRHRYTIRKAWMQMRERKKQLYAKFEHKFNLIFMKQVVNQVFMCNMDHSKFLDDPNLVERSSWVNLLIFKEVEPTSNF